MDVRRHPIHAGWEFAFADHGSVNSPADFAELEFRPAGVPGTNLTDLQAAGLVEKDTAANYEASFSLFQYMDFVYRTEFEEGEDAGRKHAHLVFEGLDTICTLFLNGEEIGSGENAYLRYRFDVAGKVRPGRNQLALIFRSPILGAATRQAMLNLKFPAHFGHDFMYIRKPAYSFFWDWGPELPVSGIYRPVALETFDHARIEEFHVRYQVDGRQVAGTVRVAAPGAEGARALLRLAGSEYAAPVIEGEAQVSFTVKDARLWYPNGEGEPFLYDMEILLEQDGVLDRRDHRIGFRTVEVVRDGRGDGKGKRFLLRVNGRDVFCRGYNWIPVDSSIPNGYYDLYRGNLDLARAANVNMLRVWGGGYYEDDEFYRMCDERGIMVWQDGMFTCSMYPDVAPDFLKLVEAELADNIKRLRNYTSLVLWCGENEAHWGWEEWWVELRAQFPRFYGAEIFDTMFALQVTQLDPDRFYWNGSPYSGEPEIRANNPHFGDMHYWSLHTNCEDLAHYTQVRPSFVSETGIQSLPDLRTALSIAPGEERSIQSLLFDTRNHFESTAKNERLLKFVGALFRVREAFDEAVILSNLAHAEYLKFAVEWWRSLAYDCAGILIWQLNDCWPAISWAAIDSNLIPKACYYYLQRAYAPDVVGFIQRFAINYSHDVNSRGDLFVASERDGEKAGVVAMRVVRITGELVAATEYPVRLDGRGVANLGEVALPEYKDHCADFVVEFTLRWEDGATARNLYTYSRPKHMRLPRPDVQVSQEAPDILRVRTDLFAKGVYLFHPEMAVVFDDNYFDLLPGEERVVRPSRPAAASEVTVYTYHHG